MNLTQTQKLWIQVGSGSAIALGAFLFGIWGSNVGNFNRYLLTALSAGATVGAVSIVRDRSGVLKLELLGLKAEVDRLQQKLDSEYQNKQKTTEIAVKLQDKVSKLQAKLDQLQAALDAAQGQNTEWQVAANQAAHKAIGLKQQVEALEGKLASSDRAWLQSRLKQSAQQSAANIDKIWGKRHQKYQAELKAESDAQIAHYCQIAEQLKAEVEQLKAELQQTQADKGELLEGLKTNYSSIVEAKQVFNAQWEQNETLTQQSIEALQRKNAELEAPRMFRGGTPIDEIGNRIIKHFAETGVILDAIESVMIPGGWRLKFKVDRNPDSTRLAETEFDKHRDFLGLWGLSQRPLDFALDTRNFIVSVDLFTTPDSGKARPAAAGSVASPPAVTAAVTPGHAAIAADLSAARFQELGCYSAVEFEQVVREKFVPRVRVVAGSTGGKSPLLELIACAIACAHGGELWLINPIPGSPKDWFAIPGVVPPGSDGIQAAIAWLGKAHTEFKARRNDLPGTASKPFITVLVDEINAIARDFPNLGTIVKDFYQLSDHTKMGFLTAGQGGNVSGVSGGSKANSKTGNASKLMEEDFQNSTQVFTAAAAKTWIKKNLKGAEATPVLDRLAALNQLCDELNQAENKSAYPRDPASKKVSPDAYRIALVVSPRESDPFFIQLPPYSSYRDRMAGISYPEGAIVTAPEANQIELGLRRSLSDSPADFICAHCGHNSQRRKGSYKSGEPRYVCAKCERVPPSLSA